MAYLRHSLRGTRNDYLDFSIRVGAGASARPDAGPRPPLKLHGFPHAVDKSALLQGTQSRKDKHPSFSKAVEY